MKMKNAKWIVGLGVIACLAWLSAGIAQEMELPGDEVSFEISPMVEPGEGEIFEAPQDDEQPQEAEPEIEPTVESPAPVVEPPAPPAPPAPAAVPAVEQTETVLPAEPVQESQQDVDAQPSPSDIVVAPSSEPAPANESVVIESAPVAVDSAAACCVPACARPVRIRTVRRGCCDPCGRRVRFVGRRCR